MENLPKDRPVPDCIRTEKSRHSPERSQQNEPLFPGIPTPEAANDRRMSQLARTIEQEIIPRLMLAHRTAAWQAPNPAEAEVDVDAEPACVRVLDATDVERFARLVLSDEEDLALESLDHYRRSGVPIDAIYLHLLAPTARFLGDLWEEDLCDFIDVTVGLGRLQRVLRELSPMYGRLVQQPLDGRRILLLPCPGEQHTFGLSMVGEFFRHAGWEVAGDTSGSPADGMSRVASEWFDVAGFSLGAALHLPALEEAIRSLRQFACNRHLPILVGGPVFAEHPDYADRVGADGMTIDGREAPALAERLIAGSAVARVVAQARRSPETGAVGARVCR